MPIPGDKARRAVNTDTGEVISRRQYQQKGLIPGTTLEKAAQIRRELHQTTKGRTLYNNSVNAYAHLHNLKRGEAGRSGEFKALYDLYKQGLKDNARWKRAEKLANSRGYTQGLNPWGEGLNYLVKALGFKRPNDYSDFGATPELT